MYQRVLVGTDGSPTATRAVQSAARLARAHGAHLTVMHAFTTRPTAELERARRDAPQELQWRLSSGAMAEAVVHAAVEAARAAAGDTLAVQGRCEPGAPVPVLLDAVAELDPDVLVIGNRDMACQPRLHPSVARRLAHRATCDVVIIDTVGRRQQRHHPTARHSLRWA